MAQSPDASVHTLRLSRILSAARPNSCHNVIQKPDFEADRARFQKHLQQVFC